MLKKDKIILVASNVDDTIKSSTVYYDITIYRTFKELIDYVENAPVNVYRIILNTRDVPFSNSNFRDIVRLYESPFVQIQENILYITDDKELQGRITEFSMDNGYDYIDCQYCDLGVQGISDAISGNIIKDKEDYIEISVQRVRADEYVRNIGKIDDARDEHFNTDEDELSIVEDLEVLMPDPVSSTSKEEVIYISGLDTKLLAEYTILKSQYLASKGKVLLIDFDTKYHRMTDMMVRSGVKSTFIDINEIFDNFSDALNKIRNSNSLLIFIGGTSKTKYSYEFMFHTLKNNLENSVDFYIYNCTPKMIPYGVKTDLVLTATIPDILISCNNINSSVSADNITFIGIEEKYANETSLYDREFRNIIRDLTMHDNINSNVITLSSLKLKGDISLNGLFMYNK